MPKVKLSNKAKALLLKRKNKQVRGEATTEPAKHGAPQAKQSNPTAQAVHESTRVKLPQDAVIVPGVYLNAHRNSAIVFAVKQSGVFYISLHTGSIEAHSTSPSTFAQDFSRHLPNYPTRRAARIYDNSMLNKSTQAQRVIKHLLVQA